MITALQSQKIGVATKLTEARLSLFVVANTQCIPLLDEQMLHTMISQLDELLSKIVTNEKLK